MRPPQEFEGYENVWQRLDFWLLRNGPVHLYLKREKLAEDSAWFEQHNYFVYRFDCQVWNSEEAFHQEMRSTLRFPAYYGNNMDAFHDCLSDIQFPKKGGGVVLEFHDLQALNRLNQQRYSENFDQSMLDSIAHNSWLLLLTGKRLITLAQTNDPNHRLDPVGCHGVGWR